MILIAYIALMIYLNVKVDPGRRQQFGMLCFHTYSRRLHIRAAVSECEDAAGAETSRTIEACEMRRQLSRRNVSRALSDHGWSIALVFDLLLTVWLSSY